MWNYLFKKIIFAPIRMDLFGSIKIRTKVEGHFSLGLKKEKPLIITFFDIVFEFKKITIF